MTSQNPDIHIVYFSSGTRNTAAFVEKLGLGSTQILTKGEPPLVTVPYVLITPTYGGGSSLGGVVMETRRAPSVPRQVSRFLFAGDNAEYMRAVMAGGNMNFGSDYGRAGMLISKKFDVPYVWRFELRGTESDVEAVLGGLAQMFPPRPPETT